MQPDTDKDLIDKVLTRDREAFESFFNAYFARLYRFCSTRVNERDAVEDIVQETLIKAMKGLHTYRGEAVLFTWLCQICRNEISNHYTRQGGKGSPLVSLDDDPAVRAVLETLASEAAETEDERRSIEKMVQLTLDYLPDRYGKVLEWKYIEGLSVDEIAGRLEESTIAVQSVLARARTAFRRAFSDLKLELSTSE